MPSVADAKPIFVVEDDEDSREATTAILEQEGFRVVPLAGYEAAVAVLEKGVMPCAVIVDQSMPGMDLCDFVRVLDRTSAAIPLIVASGAPLAADLARRAAHYLSKPYDPGELLRLVARYCTR